MHPGTHYVGLDLAWGERRPTGLAVLDETGRLVHVATVRTDEEIAAELAPYTSGPCLVAVDAPLIVRNAVGSRPAEQALSRDFRRFEAGAHPSNTGRSEFRDGPRGARLCSQLGLDMDPRSGRPRRAIEVYPHAATIVLLGLERTLKYKDKPGRTAASLQAAMLELVRRLEGLAVADPPLGLGEEWVALRSLVERATRKSELRVVEDQLDAVVCAYVALVAGRHPERMTTYGDLQTGYIVTPALTGPAVPVAEDPVRRAVREYADRHPAVVEAADQAVALMTRLLDEAGINYLTVSGRAKSVASFATKTTRTEDGRAAYPDPLRDITDQVGVRVITYVHADVAAVADLLGSQVVVLDDRDLGQETASEGRFGYASRHLLVALDPAREGQAEYAGLAGQRVSVQIRTVLQHAWAEFEHDIRYKGNVPEEHAREFDRRFTLAAGLLELADREFTTIREKLRTGGTTSPATPEDDDPRLDPRELAAFLAGQYADAGWSRTDHYTWISGLLLELGVTSLDELADVLRGLDATVLNERMDYRYPPGAVRRLDDALLAAFGERYVDLHGNAHRRGLLRTRWEKLRG